MYCWKCGTKNDDHAENCTSCQSQLLGQLTSLLEKSGGASSFKHTKMEVRFQKDSNGKDEIIVDNDEGRKIYQSIEEAPPEIRAMLEKFEGHNLNVGLDLKGGFGFGGFKVLNDFKAVTDFKTIDGESPPSHLISSAKKKPRISGHPSIEVKSDFPWTWVIGVIVFGIVIYFYLNLRT